MLSSFSLPLLGPDFSELVNGDVYYGCCHVERDDAGQVGLPGAPVHGYVRQRDLGDPKVCHAVVNAVVEHPVEAYERRRPEADAKEKQ